MDWCVYIILCSDRTLYTGITTDIRKRFGQHASRHGAKYFRGRQPDRVIYIEEGHNHSSALQREIFIKNLSRPKKLQLAATQAGQHQANALQHGGI